MRATTILAIVAIVAGIGAIGISTHLAQAMFMKPPPPQETNPPAGNPHTHDFGGEPTGNPHQGTSSGTCHTEGTTNDAIQSIIESLELYSPLIWTYSILC